MSSRVPRALAVLALVTGLLVTAVFAWRAWRQHEYEQRLTSGQVQVETLRGWMTLPYIERTHGVPQSRMREALGLPAQGGDERSLRDWFERQGIDPVQGRQKIEALILQAPASAPARDPR
ncbi:hypothetical protein [Hydrogenophaga sp.]|uniref:hypothetical protein n=1 Tax=Hydrogenophaga sp. TaxID=1904254 RepID=UPI003BAF4D28